ncbi:MAG: hypothetical protein MJ252_08185 [archaeon]|nr:hypothetical protein [archaeon]
MENNPNINIASFKKDVSKKIEADLESKDLKDLLYIYYNKNEYLSKYLAPLKNNNDSLMQQLENKNKELQSLKTENSELRSALESLQYEMSTMINDSRGLMTGNREQILQNINEISKENLGYFKTEKDNLFKKFSNKEIDYNLFKEEYKKLNDQYNYVKSLCEVIKINL